ncbi:hypothetical protein BD309DRAFT_704012 [Dichomitus squalens]|nr:hypothetical protein BD309DRAFT_704012 [Dichomitus squalens]
MFGCFLWHNEHATASERPRPPQRLHARRKCTLSRARLLYSPSASSRSFRLRRREICTHRAVDDWSLPASCGSSSEAASRASNFFQCAIPASGVIDASGSLRWRRPRRLQLSCLCPHRAHHPRCCGVDRLMRGPRCFELGLRSRALPSSKLTYPVARNQPRQERAPANGTRAAVCTSSSAMQGARRAASSRWFHWAARALTVAWRALSLSLDARSPPIASSGPQQFHRVARSHGRCGFFCLTRRSADGPRRRACTACELSLAVAGRFE